MEFFNTHKRQSHKHVKHYRSYNYHLIGTRSNDAPATKTPLKKLIIVLSVLIAIIPTLLLCQMQANPPEVEFQGTISKFKIEIKFRRCLFTFSIKRKITKGIFTSQSCKNGQSNIQKSVIQLRSCRSFSLLSLYFFNRRSCGRSVARIKETLRSNDETATRTSKNYRVFSHDVKAAILASQNNETAPCWCPK